MNAVTISDLDEELHRKLSERARANHRSLADEARYCLEVVLSDEYLLNGIPTKEWEEIEQSICETIHDQGTPLTPADFQRYREMARGRNRQ